MLKLTAALLATGMVTVTAGCLASANPGAPAAAQHASTAPTRTAQPAPATATAQAKRLTMTQARAAYSRISKPFNAAVAVVNRDVAGTAPWSKFRADTLAVVSANRAWARRIGAVRWPARVQPYITAMLRTDVPAEIRCDRAMAAAGGMQAATSVFNTDGDCRDTTANADKIRAILHLPTVS